MQAAAEAGTAPAEGEAAPAADGEKRLATWTNIQRLLDIEDQVPERANVIRVMMMELNRISSHLVALATGGMELGALTPMTFGFRERELVLDVFEMITGLRMNHAYIRPGGVSQDLPNGAVDKVRDLLKLEHRTWC